MALSTATNIIIENPIRRLTRAALLTKAATTIYQGACVALDATGTVINATSTRPCLGFARDGSTAGEQCIIDWGYAVRLTISGVGAANVGSLVYATDSNTFTLTPNTCIVGVINDIIDATNNVVSVVVNCA